MPSNFGASVTGLKELQRDLRAISKDLDKDLTKALKEAAQPAADDAEKLALGNIRNMPGSPRWAVMRIGVSRAYGAVFMVPKARSTRRTSRPNLSSLLLDEMETAVAKNSAEIADEIGGFILDLADEHGFS